MTVAELFEELYKIEYGWGTLSAETIRGWVGLTIDASAYKRITGMDYQAVAKPKSNPAKVESPKQEGTNSTSVR